MGLFNNLFKSSAETEKGMEINWVAFTDINQLEEINEISNTIPVLIFKHSTRCGVSTFALRNFQRNYSIDENRLHLYFLDLISFRAISNKVSERFNIRHQSPQVLVIKNEEIIYEASHNQISIDSIKKILQ